MTARAAIVAAFAAAVVASAFGAHYPADWWLENSIVLPAVAGLALAWRRGFVLSTGSLALLALFGALHEYGAHSTYSEAPLGELLRAHLVLARNPYDRLVHFAFGLLVAPALREVAVRAAGARGAFRILQPLTAALAISASYELVESWTARIAAPQLGAAYLGTQGDEWDAQKDMTAALAGAALALAALEAGHRRVDIG